jgi:hypothetical protein
VLDEATRATMSERSNWKDDLLTAPLPPAAEAFPPPKP